MDDPRERRAFAELDAEASIAPVILLHSPLFMINPDGVIAMQKLYLARQDKEELVY